MNTKFLFPLIAALALTIFSCDDDDVIAGVSVEKSDITGDWKLSSTECDLDEIIQLNEDDTYYLKNTGGEENGTWSFGDENKSIILTDNSQSTEELAINAFDNTSVMLGDNSYNTMAVKEQLINAWKVKKVYLTDGTTEDVNSLAFYNAEQFRFTLECEPQNYKLDFTNLPDLSNSWRLENENNQYVVYERINDTTEVSFIINGLRYGHLLMTTNDAASMNELRMFEFVPAE